jgi:hypothetical protein
MTSWIRLTVFGALAVVAFDTLASLVSRTTGIAYGWASFGSWIRYAAFGYRGESREASRSAAGC